MKQISIVLAVVLVLGLVLSTACKKKDKTPPPATTTTTKPDTAFGTFMVFVDTFFQDATTYQSGVRVYAFNDSARMDSAIKEGNVNANYQYSAITSYHSSYGNYASFTLPVDSVKGTTYWLIAYENDKSRVLMGDTSFKLYRCKSCAYDPVVIVR